MEQTENPLMRLACTSLDARISKLCAEVEGVRAHEVDAIHDMRVASRRLRAALRALRPLLQEAHAAELSNEVRIVTRQLGRPRELDVMLEMLAEEKPRATGPWLDALAAAEVALCRTRAEVDAQCALAAEAAEQIGRWDPADMVSEDAVPPDGWPTSEIDRVQRKLRKAHKRWRRSGQDEDLHAVRVAFKRLRYTVELFAPLIGDAAGNLEQLKALQQALGDWNDHRVLLEELDRHDLGKENAAGMALLRESHLHRAHEYRHAYELLAADVFAEK